MKRSIIFIWICACTLSQLYTQAVNKQLLLSTSGGTLDHAIIADFNNDGEQDCLMSLDGLFAWYETDTTGNWGMRHVMEGDATYTPVVWKVGDVNADGYLDIFYYKSDYTGTYTSVRLNPGPGSNEWPAITVPGFSVTTLMGFSDILGDGYPDMVYYDYGTHSIKCLNNTTGSFAGTTSLFVYTSTLVNNLTCDFDQDNNADFIIRTSDGKITYLHPNGDGTVTNTLIETESASCLRYGDVNGDGFDDLLYNYGTLNYQLYDPATNMFMPKTIISTFSPTYFNALDVNGDENDDIVWQVLDVDGTKEILWAKNEGGTIDLAVPMQLVDSLKDDTYIFYMDIDRDARIDIFEGLKKKVQAHNQDTIGIFSASYEPDTAYNTIILTTSADIDTNGTVDIVFINNQGVVGWLETDDSLHHIINAHSLPKVEAGPSPVSLLCTDLDMDGDSDIIASFKIADGFDKWSYYFINNGAGSFAVHQFSSLAYKKIGLVDGNADGDNDLIALADNGYLYMYQNTMDTAAIFSLPTILGSGCYDFLLQDINADGFIDIVNTKSYDDIQKFINTPDALYFSLAADFFHPTCLVPTTLYTDDLDADGDADYIYTCNSYQCYMAINDAGGFSHYNIGTMYYEGNSETGFTQMLDVNGDGNTDLIYASEENGMKVKLSVAPTEFADGYLTFSEDFGRILEADIPSAQRFLGSNIFEFYITDNPFNSLINIDLTDPTLTWLAENGATDSMVITVNQIPQEPFQVIITPGTMLNAGAGAGNVMNILFSADSTALIPKTIYIFVDHSDTIPELALTQTVHIHFDIDLYPELIAELDTTIQYLITDDDPALFVSVDEVTKLEDGVVTTIQVTLNVYQTTASSIVAVPEPDIETNAGIGEPVTMPLLAGAASVATKTYNVVSSNDNYDEPDLTEYVNYNIVSDLAMLDTLTPTPLTVHLIDNDAASLLHITPSLSPVEEEGAAFSTKFKATSSPYSDVLVICDPDDQLDLGNGAGIPVTLTFPAGVYIPVYLDISGWAVDEGIAEGEHIGTISYSIVSDDPAYAVYAFDDNYINIIDDETVGFVDQASSLPIFTTVNNDVLLISAAGNTSTLELFIFSSNGQQVYADHFSGDIYQTNLQTLAAGSYIVYVTNGRSNATSSILMH